MVIQELHRSGDVTGVRALLRERDELAIQLLRTLGQLDQVREDNMTCLAHINQARHEAKPLTQRTHSPTHASEVPPYKLNLLKGVVMVCLCTTYAACGKRVQDTLVAR